MTHRFTVRAAADPQSLSRVIGQLVRQWVTPVRLLAERVGDDLLIDIEVDGLADATSELIGATLGSCVLVRAVSVRPGRADAVARRAPGMGQADAA